MRRFSQITSLLIKLDQRIQHLSLPAFVWLRWCFVITYLASFVERFLDAEYITATSLAYTDHLLKAPVHRYLADLLLTSPDFYRFFICVLALIAIFYGTALGGLWIGCLFLILEFIMQIVSAGNVYGHEGFIHQFLLLMILTEAGQGRIHHNHRWFASRLSGIGILLLRWQFIVLNFMAGLGKVLSSDWKNNNILDRIFMNSLYNGSFFDPLYTSAHTWIAPLLKYIIIGFQILFPAFIFIKPLRRWIFAVGILIHTFIAIKMSLYFFSFFVVSLYLLFWESNSKDRMSSQNSPDNPSH